jgi:hypothetical protein
MSSSHLHGCALLPVCRQCLRHLLLQQVAQVVGGQVLCFKHGLRAHLDALTRAHLQALHSRNTQHAAT